MGILNGIDMVRHGDWGLNGDAGMQLPRYFLWVSSHSFNMFQLHVICVKNEHPFFAHEETWQLNIVTCLGDSRCDIRCCSFRGNLVNHLKTNAVMALSSYKWDCYETKPYNERYFIPVKTVKGHNCRGILISLLVEISMPILTNRIQ